MRQRVYEHEPGRQLDVVEPSGILCSPMPVHQEFYPLLDRRTLFPLAKFLLTDADQNALAKSLVGRQPT